MRRVVVTGIGAISPIGPSFAASWKQLIQSQSTSQVTNTAFLTLEEALCAQALPPHILDRELALSKLLPCQIAAPVRGLDYDARTARSAQLILRAGEEAMVHSGLSQYLGSCTSHKEPINHTVDSNHEDSHIHERIGTSVGCGMSSVREVVDAYDSITRNQSIRKLSPHFVPKVLANSNAGRLSLRFGLKGPNLASSSACAAGANAIGDAFRCIQHNNADIMLAGGTESCIDPISMAGFCRLKALSTSFNHNPSMASRPFHALRDGFVMAEGAAILVLEELNHAISRNATILCELRGYGLSGDAFHLTSPDPNGKGAIRAMSMAIQDAGLKPEYVDYVNAHATSTPLGDEIEAKAIDSALLSHNHVKPREKDLFVSSTKGATGHLLGAAGALEAAFTVMTTATGIIPHTMNLHDDHVCNQDVRFRHVFDAPMTNDINVAISNSFGFGGTNACLVFSNLI